MAETYIIAVHTYGSQRVKHPQMILVGLEPTTY